MRCHHRTRHRRYDRNCRRIIAMSLFILDNELLFPPQDLAEPDGLLAVGGDLSKERLLLAYQSGIFPWYSEDSPIMWYSPHERFVIYADDLHISSSMKKFLRKSPFIITQNQAFE